MARRPVVLDPAVIDEAAHARRWYAGQNPDTAAQFMAELDRAVALVYQVAATEVRVIALAHGRRRPGYWKGRL
jgi:hypothetical protein